MSIELDNEDTTYRVVVNQEEQYSIWPEHLDVPLGWREIGKSGSKSECIDFISQIWTDMRRLSVRDKPIQSQ